MLKTGLLAGPNVALKRTQRLLNFLQYFLFDSEAKLITCFNLIQDDLIDSRSFAATC